MKEHMIGKVIEVGDNSMQGYHYDVFNDSEELTYLLEQFEGKTVKVTIEIVE